jgi:hypothetical protein
MAAQPVTKLPEGDDWLYELKLDGSPYSGSVTGPILLSTAAVACPNVSQNIHRLQGIAKLLDRILASCEQSLARLVDFRIEQPIACARLCRLKEQACITC